MRRILIAVVALLAFTACTMEMSEVEVLKTGALQTIRVNVAGFGDQTKTAVDTSGHFTWSMGDQIGIYPVDTTLGTGQTAQQILFKINGSGVASSATFTGTGWGLVTGSGYKYFSYYPYDSTAEYDEVAVSFADNLNQTANASSAHVAVNDYLYAPAIQPTDAASCVFGFKHIGVLAEFEITMPSYTWTRKFTRMEVYTTDSIFAVSGKYNPSSATVSVAPILTEKEYTNELNLQFNGGVGFTPNAEGKIYAYFLIAPAATSGKKLDIKLWDEDNKVYVASITPGSDWVSQEYKRGKCTVSKPEITNLSESGTANCYIVPEEGKYKFLANVRGNGEDPVMDDSEGPSIDMTGCSAEVIWETVNTNVAPDTSTIVKNSTIKIDGNYIVFDATGAEGNALIALKKGDDIVWSWHIWSTSAYLKGLAQNYGGASMMDRNLGALSATPGDGLTVGFHYQWGRPFPITGGSATSTGAFSSDRMATTNSTIWVEEETTIDRGTLAYSAANPTHFICASASNYYKGKTSGSVSFDWIWAADATTGYEYGKAPAFWGSKKTMYDPCPVGWKVPVGGSTGVFVKANFNDNLIPSSKGRILSSSPEVFYPYSGYRGRWDQPLDAVLYNVGSYAIYWTSTGSGDQVRMLYTHVSVVVQDVVSARFRGQAIRPCLE